MEFFAAVARVIVGVLPMIATDAAALNYAQMIEFKSMTHIIRVSEKKELF